MEKSKTRAVLNAFAVIAFLAVGAVGLFFLWGGRGGDLSYVEMACSIEGKEISCVDNLQDWNEGLRYYDSTLSVTSDTLGSLKSLLWEYWAIDFAGAANASSSQEVIFPLSVLQNKKSGCVGFAWLALMVAEVRNINLHAVLLPGHVFLQYGSPENVSKVNLEPNRRGYSYTDEEYRQKYKAGPWTGLEFKPLEARQLVGLAAFDVGNLYLKEDASKALKWYRLAEEFFPEFPGISANQNVAKQR